MRHALELISNFVITLGKPKPSQWVWNC